MTRCVRGLSGDVVKPTGVTTHEVTAELDAGAIIEQDVSRVSRRDPGPSSSAREGVNVVGHFGSSPGSVLRRGA